MKHKSLIRFLLVSAVSIVIFVIVGFVWLGQYMDGHRNTFSKIHPGMSKAQVKAIAGTPLTVDTSRQALEVWEFEVPSLFAERPHCYFELDDSTLVRFMWEPRDTALPGYEFGATPAD